MSHFHLVITFAALLLQMGIFQFGDDAVSLEVHLSRSQQKSANHLLPIPRSHHLQIFFSSFFELIHTIRKDSIQSQATYIKLILEP
jgi:hypothetical protein